MPDKNVGQGKMPRRPKVRRHKMKKNVAEKRYGGGEAAFKTAH